MGNGTCLTHSRTSVLLKSSARCCADPPWTNDQLLRSCSSSQQPARALRRGQRYCAVVNTLKRQLITVEQLPTAGRQKLDHPLPKSLPRQHKYLLTSPISSYPVASVHRRFDCLTALAPHQDNAAPLPPSRSCRVPIARARGSP